MAKFGRLGVRSEETVALVGQVLMEEAKAPRGLDVARETVASERWEVEEVTVAPVRCGDVRREAEASGR